MHVVVLRGPDYFPNDENSQSGLTEKCGARSDSPPTCAALSLEFFARGEVLWPVLSSGRPRMSGRLGGFHRKHGANIRLSEDNTVAHRADSYNKAVVFTEHPIAVGNTFKVKLLDKGGGWAGSIVSEP